MKDVLYQVNTPPKALDLFEIPATPAKSIPLLDIPGFEQSDPIFETYSSHPVFPQAITKSQQTRSGDFIDEVAESIKALLKDYYDAHRHEKNNNTLMAWVHNKEVSDLAGIVKYSASLFICIFTAPPFLEDFSKLITGMKNAMIEDGGYDCKAKLTMNAIIQTYAEVLRLLLAEFSDARNNIITIKGNDSWTIWRMLAGPHTKHEIEIIDVIRFRFNMTIEGVLPQLPEFLRTDNM